MTAEWTEVEAAIQRECWARGFLLDAADLAAEVAARSIETADEVRAYLGGAA